MGSIFTDRNTGKRRYGTDVDGGYINKGKAVCADYKINKKELESFVIKAVRNKILTSDLPRRVEELLMKKINESSAEKYTTIERYQRSLGEVKARIDRLVTSIENGVDVEEIFQRVKETKKEKQACEQKIEQLKASSIAPSDIIDAKAQVQYLMDNFENILSTSPVSLQKELLRKFIQVIEVDRVSDSVIVYLKKIPTLSEKFQVLTNVDPSIKGQESGCVVAEKKLRKGQFKSKTKATDTIAEQGQKPDVFTEDQRGAYPEAV